MFGNRLVITGTTGAVMRNESALEVAEPGLVAVILAVPTFAVRISDTDANNTVGLIRVVGTGEPFQ